MTVAGTMAEENWDDVPSVQPQVELPEIKLFGRWSCDDVQVSDMSLQVNISYDKSKNMLTIGYPNLTFCSVRTTLL